MSLNPSIYAPSDVLNAPALLYAGQGQPLTPVFATVTSGASVTIPTSAITWSISTSASGSATVTVNGANTTILAGMSLSGSGTLYYPITVTASSDTVVVAYTLDNVVYNTPGYY